MKKYNKRKIEKKESPKKIKKIEYMYYSIHNYYR